MNNVRTGMRGLPGKEHHIATTSALPQYPASQLGPMARVDLRDGLHKQVQQSVATGAKILCGGTPVAGKGACYPPTVLSQVEPGMPAFDDETFGPVAANTSQYGLSGNLWTGDVDRARKLARELETGGVFINGITASNPRVPVGGIKNSEYGRELSHFGPHAFVNTQTVWIETESTEGDIHPRV